MNTPIELNGMDGERMVYIRPVDVAELPAELREQALGRDRIYAVHAPDGARLALVHNRRLAFELARQNDFAPVGVH